MKYAVRALPHLLAWGFVTLFPNAGMFQWYWQGFSSESDTLLIPSLYGMALNATVFYFHALWIYPKKKNETLIKPYWLWVVLLIAVASLAEGALDHFYASYYDAIPPEVRSLSVGAQIIGRGLENTVLHVVYWSLSFVYIRLRRSRHLEAQQKVLAQEKVVSELQYLRAQMNPHVLFNGINSVYHLIDEQPERAKQTLLTFSDLLRYQLYECQAERVPLDRELEQLANYVTLEETRKGEDARITWEMPTDDLSAQIAPMLLQPLIENAFKHLSHHDDPAQNQLRLTLDVDQGVLSLNVENTVSSNTESDHDEGGVGLANVQRRLQLIYPDRHQLLVSRPPGRFRVHLMITL